MSRARNWLSGQPDRIGWIDDIPDLPSFHELIRQYKVSPDKMSNRVMLTLHERADVCGAPPELLEFTRLFLGAMRKRNIPLYVHSCWRSPMLQKKLYDEGKTTLLSGAHQRSAAVDIVHGYYHWNAKDDFWRYLGQIGEHIIRQNKLPIEWGGRWDSFPDPAHWQVKDWKQRVIVDDDHEPLKFHPFSKALRYV